MNCASKWKPLKEPSVVGTVPGCFIARGFPNKATDKALLLFHRGHEHSGRWQETVDSLNLDDVAIFAWDARGHGRSPENAARQRVFTT